MPKERRQCFERIDDCFSGCPGRSVVSQESKRNSIAASQRICSALAMEIP